MLPAAKQIRQERSDLAIPQLATELMLRDPATMALVAKALVDYAKETPKPGRSDSEVGIHLDLQTICMGWDFQAKLMLYLTLLGYACYIERVDMGYRQGVVDKYLRIFPYPTDALGVLQAEIDTLKTSVQALESDVRNLTRD
jgi:hypothetical protein